MRQHNFSFETELNGLTSCDIENISSEVTSPSQSICLDSPITEKNNDELKIILFLIHCTTELNNTRLYWLWIKYSLMVSERDIEQTTYILKTLGPITDALSYGLYLARIGLVLLYIIKTDKNDMSTYQFQLVSDALWGISNFLSAVYLQSASPRPAPYTRGWHGNLNMQILLVYDLAILGVQYVVECKKQTQIIAPDNPTPNIMSARLDQHYYKKSLLIQLSYAGVIIFGFCIFRGFFCQKNFINPLIGAGLCVGSTIVTNSIEWINLLNKNDKIRKIFRIQESDCKNKLLIALCNLLQITFPIILWFSFEVQGCMWTIAIGLTCMTLLNAYVKQAMSKSKSALLASSIFNQSSDERQSSTHSLDSPPLILS
ncbi:MAG: hypothetical protein Q8R83_06690 [Legionellaceae bacterium]|nr:hypothetical protein [Legionellaceae bacterium]